MRLRSMVTFAIVLMLPGRLPRSRPRLSVPPPTKPKPCCRASPSPPIELSTGAQFVSVTDERGEYRLLQMAPGTLQGAGRAVRLLARSSFPSFELLVGQNATVPFAMKLASVTETLTVTGEAPLVDTNSSQVAGNVNPRQMEECRCRAATGWSCRRWSRGSPPT